MSALLEHPDGSLITLTHASIAGSRESGIWLSFQGLRIREKSVVDYTLQLERTYSWKKVDALLRYAKKATPTLKACRLQSPVEAVHDLIDNKLYFRDLPLSGHDPQERLLKILEKESQIERLNAFYRVVYHPNKDTFYCGGLSWDLDSDLDKIERELETRTTALFKERRWKQLSQICRFT